MVGATLTPPRRLFPLQSVFHIPPACLHVGISMGTMAVIKLEIATDIRDGRSREADLARIAEMVEGEEEVEEAELEELGEEELRRRVERKRKEREWAEATQKVEELVEEEKAAVGEVKEREHLATRVRLAAAGRVQELAAHAKAVTKKRDPAKRFVPCGCCLLTPFDTKVEWRVCEGCGTRCHLMCQLESLVTEDQALPAALPFTCRVCHSTATFPHLSRQVEAEVEELKAKVVEASRQLAAAQVELAAKRGEVTDERGEHRRHLDEVLERIGATRQQYHGGGTFIGRHVDKIFARAEELAEVLEEGSEERRGFLEFALLYRRVHFLAKARRQLEEEEIVEVEEKTKLLGEVMPRVLGGTITPKQHWLVHHLGPFARRWRTIGLFREEGMDNLL